MNNYISIGNNEIYCFMHKQWIKCESIKNPEQKLNIHLVGYDYSYDAQRGLEMSDALNQRLRPFKNADIKLLGASCAIDGTECCVFGLDCAHHVQLENNTLIRSTPIAINHPTLHSAYFNHMVSNHRGKAQQPAIKTYKRSKIRALMTNCALLCFSLGLTMAQTQAFRQQRHAEQHLNQQLSAMQVVPPKVFAADYLHSMNQIGRAIKHFDNIEMTQFHWSRNETIIKGYWQVNMLSMAEAELEWLDFLRQLSKPAAQKVLQNPLKGKWASKKIFAVQLQPNGQPQYALRQ